MAERRRLPEDPLLAQEKKRGRHDSLLILRKTSVSRKIYLVQPASQLVARRPKVPPATSHTFCLFSLNNIHFYHPCNNVPELLNVSMRRAYFRGAASEIWRAGISAFLPLGDRAPHKGS